MICEYCYDDVEREATVEFQGTNICEECAKDQEPHTCPFKVEIYEDEETLCTCGLAQEHECAMDI